MKKILTVSLLAVMAVSGARADIASTKYVDDAVSPKLDANSAITAGTHSVITYDAKGLVTAGRDLTKEDIPTIEQSQVNGLTTALAGKQANLEAGTYTTVDGNKVNVTVDGSVEQGSAGLVTGGTVYSAIEAVKAGGVQDASTTQKGIVQIGDNIGVNNGVISVADAGTTKGVVKEAGNNDGIKIESGSASVGVGQSGTGTIVKSLQATADGIQYNLGALSASEIPTIEQSQVNGLTDALNSKQVKLDSENVTVAQATIPVDALGTAEVLSSTLTADGDLKFVEVAVVSGDDMEAFVSDAISEIETNVDQLQAFDASMTVNSKAVSESLNNMSEAGTYALTAKVEKNAENKLVVTGYAWEYIGR